MKKQYVTLLVITILACIIYTSCTNKASENTGRFELEQIKIDKTAHLFGDSTKPGTSIKIDFAYIAKSSNKELQDSLNSYFSQACFEDKYVDEEVTEHPALYAQNYISEYRQNLEPMFMADSQNKENAATMASWYSHYKNIESKVMYYQQDLLVYRIDTNEYTGGAHGMHKSIFMNFDLKNIHQLTLDDIFVGEYQEILSELLWQQLIYDQKATSRTELEDIGYGSLGDLIGTENFYLSKEGITFFYNVYEFTPYSMGTTEIRLPYPALAHILSDNSLISQLRK